MIEHSRRILTVGTASTAQQPIAAALAAWPDLRLSSAADAGEARDVARRVHPDLVMVWSGSPPEVVAAISGAIRGAPPPVLAVLASAEPAAAAAALAGGAADVLRPGLTAQEITARLDILLSLSAARSELARQATVDGLTGTLTRRAFLARATEEVERSHRYRQALSLLVVDVDSLKTVNIGRGTAAGDAALRRVAATCAEVLRETDLLGRLGDDEMAVLLPSTGGSGALALAERLRAEVAQASVEVTGAAPFGVTVCIGGAEAGDDSVEVLVGRAEKALATAQGQGRDRVMLAVGGR